MLGCSKNKIKPQTENWTEVVSHNDYLRPIEFPVRHAGLKAAERQRFANLVADSRFRTKLKDGAWAQEWLRCKVGRTKRNAVTA